MCQGMVRVYGGHDGRPAVFLSHDAELRFKSWVMVP